MHLTAGHLRILEKIFLPHLYTRQKALFGNKRVFTIWQATNASEFDKKDKQVNFVEQPSLKNIIINEKQVICNFYITLINIFTQLTMVICLILPGMLFFKFFMSEFHWNWSLYIIHLFSELNLKTNIFIILTNCQFFHLF